MSEESSTFRNIMEWVLVIVIAVAATILIRTFIVEPYRIPTGSMETTIEVGDQILGQKVTLELGQKVKNGEIVIFKNPEEDVEHGILVKRVIAQGGQTVDLKDGYVYVDGVKLDEDYIQGKSYPLEDPTGQEISYPYTVPEGSVWVMGDNRENSRDSRVIGAVPENNLVAVALVRYWPLNRIGTL